MKIQIRRNVFETNSSSVHTLSIVPNLPDGFVFPEKVVFGKGADTYSNYAKYRIEKGDTNVPFDEYSSPLQEKLDIIAKCIMCNYTASYIKAKNQIIKVLGSVGITCEFPESEKYINVNNIENEYDWCEENESGFFESLIYDDIDENTKKKSNTPLLLNFLFDDESFSEIWADDCCSGPRGNTENKITFQTRLS